MRSFIVTTVILGVFSQENKTPGLKILNTRVEHQIQRRKADKSLQYGAPAPPAPSYGAPPPPASDVVDLHNKEFCVDVSSYQPVIWVERDGEECHTVFVKKCEDKQENVCADVTETRCEVSETTINRKQTKFILGSLGYTFYGMLHGTRASAVQ